MQKPGDEFLAGAGFTDKQRRGFGLRSFDNQPPKVLHRFGNTDEPRSRRRGGKLILDSFSLLLLLLLAVNQDVGAFNLGKIERRRHEIIERPRPHRLNGPARVAVGGDHRDKAIGIHGVEFGDETHSVRMQADKRRVVGGSLDDRKRIVIGADNGVVVSTVGEPLMQLALFIVVMKDFQEPTNRGLVCSLFDQMTGNVKLCSEFGQSV
jgi:hypothetical protein